MSEVWKERIPCTSGADLDCNFLKVKVYYDLGGVSWATYEQKKRGYYLSVTPIKAEGCFESFMAFSGMYVFLNEVARQSKKGEELAMKLAQEKKQMLIDAVCKEHGITVKESA